MSFDTSSSIEVHGADHAKLQELWIASRHPGGQTTRISGDAANLTLIRYEYSLHIASYPVVGNDSLEEQPEVTSVVAYRNDARFELLESRPGSALVFGVESADIGGLNDLGIQHQTSRPLVRAAGGTRHDGSLFMADEWGRWHLPGNYLHMDVPAVSGTGTGRFHLYVFQSTLTLSSPTGAETLEASVREENLDPLGGVRVRHVVWYELLANHVTTAFAASVHPDGSRPIAFARDVLVQNATDAAADNPTNVSGDLPAEARTNESAIWVRGRFDFAAHAGLDASGSMAPYHAQIAGRIDALSRGGAAEIAFGSNAAVATSLAIFLLVGLYVARDVILEAIARAFGPLYTKLRKDQLLDVPARDSIFRLVKQTPGINFLNLFRQLRNNVGTPVAFGALAYHLSQMERFELIISKREGRFRRYYDVGAAFGADTSRIALLQTHPIPIIAKAVLEAPGLTQAELQARLARELPITRQGVAYHLRRLERKELVFREEVGRFSKYRPTERLERLARFAISVPPVDAGPSAIQASAAA